MTDIQITKNFTLSQLLHSDTATRNHITEQFNPPQDVIDNLKHLTINILQPLRDILGEDFFITCAYRCEAVNRAVGGAANSQHLLGQASDNVYSGGNLILAKTIVKALLPFDQLILEGGTFEKPNWIHVSYSDRNRKEILRADFSTGRPVYSAVSRDQLLNTSV